MPRQVMSMKKPKPAQTKTNNHSQQNSCNGICCLWVHSVTHAFGSTGPPIVKSVNPVTNNTTNNTTKDCVKNHPICFSSKLKIINYLIMDILDSSIFNFYDFDYVNVLDDVYLKMYLYRTFHNNI